MGGEMESPACLSQPKHQFAARPDMPGPASFPLYQNILRRRRRVSSREPDASTPLPHESTSYGRRLQPAIHSAQIPACPTEADFPSSMANTNALPGD